MENEVAGGGGGDEECVNILVVNLERKRALGRRKSTWENNIIMYVGE
jgi:hypothetical protein